MNLSEFRSLKDMTQHQMSSVLGISFSLYSKIEAGARNPSYNFILRLTKEFPDANPNELFFNN